ncbi:MAG: Tex family protein [Bacteroidales bacterium]|nr:Tex family protein [Bacteroidales bacterium]
MTAEQYSKTISGELGISHGAVKNTIQLLKDGSTVPFISRYRKEATGSLDEVQITAIRDRMLQLEVLEKRREAVLKSLQEQQVLTSALQKQVDSAFTLAELEDIYLPYKPKRKTRAFVARNKGLEPLAKLLLSRRLDNPEQEAREFVNPDQEVKTPEEALSGARDIIAEWINEDATLRARLRKLFHQQGYVTSKVITGKEEEGKKYETYFDYREGLRDLPSHRILAMLRGENEGVLRVRVLVDEEEAMKLIATVFMRPHHTQNEVLKAAEDAYKRLLHPSMENEMRSLLKEKADKKAIAVFAQNVRQLLLAPPMGAQNIMAIDPGFRSGCKVVCLDKSGYLQYNETIYPHPPQRDTKTAARKISYLVKAYKIEAIAIGNGTAGRETERFIRKIRFDRDIIAVMVNENGASVYSASDLARKEFPDYDVTVRGAVSIGRRAADPLAELVKIDPKAIGVGQYQHDVDQKALNNALTDTVELCVNAVGVEVNTASRELLTYVAGIGPALADKIVEYRQQKGGFRSRKELKKVPRFGEKAFEQSAGFLRVRDADNPLEISAVHPESYAVVEKMAASLNASVKDLMSSQELRKKLRLQDFVTTKTGMPTLTDIMQELEKPGRDPRESYDMFQFDESVQDIKDVKEGMTLPGIVTNITDFGAFVDIGVHQDGLVHISHLANRFVKDPNEVVTLNQKVKVKVLSVDIPRKRLQLSMKEAE